MELKELRWRLIDDDCNCCTYECPNCYWNDELLNINLLSLYCPHCGQRLLPPEGEEG